MNEFMSLHIPVIDFDMPITDLIMRLEQLRYKDLSTSTTHPLVLTQIKEVFQMLESIGSSRIEGNNTTIIDYVETTKIDKNYSPIDERKENIREIMNLENAMRYIEENIYDTPISMQLIRELHMLAVQGLSYHKEGAAYPGDFRNGNVKINGSSHTPPDFTQVPPLMEELIDFVNKEDPQKYDLIKIAIAHHRFVWIHPFENGNGRVVRLFTYALFLKNVFKSRKRIINPTAVFCSNRSAYYDYLAKADNDGDSGLIAWSQYMLEGLKIELEKIDKLIDYQTLKEIILYPALADALEKKYITSDAHSILKLTIDNEDQQLQSSDLIPLFPRKSSSERSRLIRSLIDQRLLIPLKKGARKYVICFSNNFLMRSVLKALDEGGFLPNNSFEM